MDLYAVLGNPINHSKSPFIHTLFAKQTNQKINYQAILVGKDNLESTLNHFQQQGGKGVNITSPFKQQAFHLVDLLSDRARKAQAVNTIKFNEDGSRFGDNTDGVGFINDILINHQFIIKNKNILILGAGGATRGILEPLLQQQPSQLVITNRTMEKATALANLFLDQENIKALSNFSNQSFDLIINATSANLENEFIPNHLLNKSVLCYDLAYSQNITPFLQWAKQNGARYRNGLGMLIEQAAESFLLWRNVKPDTKIVLKQLRHPRESGDDCVFFGSF